MVEGPARAVDRERGNADIVGGLPSSSSGRAAWTRASGPQGGRMKRSSMVGCAAIAAALGGCGATEKWANTDPVERVQTAALREDPEAVCSPRVKPPRLAYSTFFGGSDWDQPVWSTLARDGSYYIAGVTFSQDLPTTAGAYRRSPIGGWDTYVAKFDRHGTLVYSTYLGGAGDDFALGIAVDARGAAYVVGFTNSQDFPVTGGAFQSTFAGGNNDAFAVKLAPDGSRLEYSTYLGGSDDELAYIGPIDRAGHLHVMGYTYSADFPVTPGAFQTAHAGAADAFVAKLNARGTKLVYATFVGGSGEDQGWDGNIDDDGNVYLDGSTTSADFPVTHGAFQPGLAGTSDAFVFKLSQDGSRLVLSSYLGGTGDEFVSDLGLDADGNIYVVGSTSSTDFPVTRKAAQPAFAGGGEDGFIAKIDRAGRRILYSTYVGGSGMDVVGGIRIDGHGAMYLHGTTDSSDLATTPDALQSANLGGGDLFVMKLGSDGEIAYATYLGGTGWDYAWGAGSDLDAQGHYHFAAVSCSEDFPVTADAYQRTAAGGCDTTFSVVSFGAR
jgi:hypothetical protein